MQILRKILRRFRSLIAYLKKAKKNKDAARREAKNRRRLNKFKDVHKGQRCFIICNGPSINKLDLTKMKNEITFGCNRIYLNYNKMGFRPTYYFFIDTVGAIVNRDDSLNYIKHPDVKAGFFMGYTKDYIKGKKCYYLSKGSWSVTMTMIKMALFMGCNPIYIVGLDLDYNYPPLEDRIHYERAKDLPFDAKTKRILSIVIDQERRTQIEKIFTLKDGVVDNSHFRNDYFSDKSPAYYVTKDEAIAAHKKMVEELSNEDKAKIYNAGVGGHCDFLKRVDYNSLF